MLGLLCACGLVHAEGLQTYVADDIHTIEPVVRMAFTARAALANDTVVVLTRDGQVPALNEKADLVASAEAKGVSFFVCDSDVRAYGNPGLPSGVQVINTHDEDPDTPRSTISKMLSHTCRHGEN